MIGKNPCIVIQRAMTLPMLSGGWLRIRVGTFRFRGLSGAYRLTGLTPACSGRAALATDARR